MSKISELNGNHSYKDPVLASVITLTEASALWNVSTTYIRNMIREGNIEGRKAITGGTWLVTTSSCIVCLGMLQNHTLTNLRIKDSE